LPDYSTLGGIHTSPRLMAQILGQEVLQCPLGYTHIQFIEYMCRNNTCNDRRYSRIGAVFMQLISFPVLIFEF